MIVDDEPTIVSALLQYLHRRGFRVAGVTTPDLAESLAMTGMFDLIIMDINLGPVKGTEIVRRLKETGFKGETLFITAYPDRYREELQGVEMKRVIQKPFKMYTIVERIKEIEKDVHP